MTLDEFNALDAEGRAAEIRRLEASSAAAEARTAEAQSQLEALRAEHEQLKAKIAQLEPPPARSDAASSLQRWDCAGLAERAGVPFAAAKAFLSGLVVTEPERTRIIDTLETHMRREVMRARRDGAHDSTALSGMPDDVLKAYVDRERTDPTRPTYETPRSRALREGRFDDVTTEPKSLEARSAAMFAEGREPKGGQ
jgi:hypothetical protein